MYENISRRTYLINKNTYILYISKDCSFCQTSHMAFELLWYLRLTDSSSICDLHVYCVCVGGRDDTRAGGAAQGLVYFPGRRPARPAEQHRQASRGWHHHRAHKALQHHGAWTAATTRTTATGSGSGLYRQQPGRKRWWGRLDTFMHIFVPQAAH